MNEFDIIKHFFAQPTLQRADVILGSGDDAAILQIPKNQQLVVTIDTLIEGVHFSINTPAYDIGYKSLAVNLSDLAAMGAEPAWATMALTLPNNNDKWLQEFSQGFFELAQQFNVQLIGGDLTRGPTLTISVQAHGFVPHDLALRRDHAKVGDLIYITGTIGDAGLALMMLKMQQQVPTALLTRLNKPTPRISAGIALRNIANSMIDISDGLVADLNHILESSHVGATIDVDNILYSAEFKKIMSANNLANHFDISKLQQLAITAGDDYELCFTISPEKESLLKEVFNHINCPYQKIGVIEKESGLRMVKKDGSLAQLDAEGYRHF